MVTWRRAWTLGAAALVIAGSACQVIGGIGDIELARDGGSPVDARLPGHPDGPLHKDAGVPHTDGGKPPADGGPPGADASHDAGVDVAAPVLWGRPCTGPHTACTPSGTVLTNGDEYCADGGAVSCGNMDQPCCPGNANGRGTSGGICGQGFLNQTACVAGSCGQCGNGGQPCCLASQGMGGGNNGPCQNGYACIAGECTQCGDEGQPCCDDKFGNQPCRSAAACGTSSGICINCGCTSMECCDGNGACIAANATCSNGRTCLPGESCDQLLGNPPCGAVGGPCCTGEVCTDGSLCVSGTCTACGAMGGPCCVDRAGKKACSTGVCSNDGSSCVGCGGAGQPCCPGDTCTNGACDPATNMCNPDLGCTLTCGGVGQVCCSGSCAPGDCCDTTTLTLADGGACVAPGALCGNKYLCSNGLCVCGGVGQPCCAAPSKACNTDGGTCNGSGKCT